MHESIDGLLELVTKLPVEVLYLLVGAGAAIENLFPPIPSDMFVVAGAVAADRGLLDGRIVFLVAWASNLVLALLVYGAARRYGGGIFGTRWGRWLLRPEQLHRMSLFYREYGTLTILVSRFFPVFRVLVPAFAGISKLGFWRTAIPLTLASAAWYGVLVTAGVLFSRNIDKLIGSLRALNTTAGLLAGLATLLLLLLWWRSRHPEEPDE
ncbi:MAG: DedA family protein [Gemmatimonadota bacterium]|jgi:membrane protein DedA with SNARE-associated domain